MRINKCISIICIWTLFLGLLVFPTQTFAAPVGDSGSTPSGVAIADLEKTVDEVMEKHIGKTVPGAAVSIVKDGRVILTKGYGFSDVENQIPMDVEKTYLEAGSISKLFTWTAVMQLAEQGQIDLTADVSKYLPEGFLKLKYPVTMAHLMSHTAGFEERTEGLFVSDPAELIVLGEYLRAPHQPKQIYQPGTVIAYSNFGTNLAGYIVERLSGMPFEQYVEQHIFLPLEMDDATFVQDYSGIAEVLTQKSKGYLLGKDGFSPRPNIYINDMPAGSLQTTAENMAHFMIAHLNTQGNAPYQLFAHQETLRKMQEVSFTENALLPGNAHGFWERFAGEYRVLEHGGNTESFSALVSIVPEENFGICTLTNVGGEMSGVRTDLLNVLVGEIYSNPQANASLDHSKEVAGWYKSARAVESGLVKVVSALAGSTDMQVKANDDGSIQVSIPMMGVLNNYVETAPYFYERVEAEDTLIDHAGLPMSRLSFIADEQGQVIQASSGVVADYLAVPFYQATQFNLIALGLDLLLFAVGLFWGIIAWVISFRKEKKGGVRVSVPLRKWNTILSATGFFLLGIVGVVLLLLMSNPFRALTSFNLLIVAVWLFTLIFVVAFCFGINHWRDKTSTSGKKVLYVLLSLGLFALCIFLLENNFYLFY